MKTHLFLALALIIFYETISQNLVPAPSGIGHSVPKINCQASNAVTHANPITNLTSNLNLWQAPAYYIYLEGEQAQKAIADMLGDASFEEFTARYNCKRIEKQVQVTRFKFKDSYQREVTEYTSLGGEAAGAHQMNFLDDTLMGRLPLQTHWIFEYRTKTPFVKAFVQAFYLTSDFATLSLPPALTSMLQQGQTMVDTTTQFLQNQLTFLNYQLQEAKQLQTSMFLLSRSASDREARRKRR